RSRSARSTASASFSPRTWPPRYCSWPCCRPVSRSRSSLSSRRRRCTFRGLTTETQRHREEKTSPKKKARRGPMPPLAVFLFFPFLCASVSLWLVSSLLFAHPLFHSLDDDRRDVIA